MGGRLPQHRLKAQWPPATEKRPAVPDGEERRDVIEPHDDDKGGATDELSRP